MVGDDVMQLQQQMDLAAVCIGGADKLQQGRTLQVHAEMLHLHALAQQLFGTLPSGWRQLLPGQAHLAQHHLQRLAQSLPQDGAAQHIVTRHHPLHGGAEALQTSAMFHTQQHRQDVGIARAAHQMMEQQAFLQRCQGIDVLDVGHATWQLAGDQVDLLLAEADQRQECGGDVPATRRNQVVRDRHDIRRARLQYRGQRRQGGQLEHLTHLGLPAGRFQARQQFDDTQRMTAQIEEIVVAADARHLQDVLPDGGQEFFALTSGSHMLRPSACGLRGWQGGAIELAIGGQRQLGEHHEGRWQHVVGQLLAQGRTQRRRLQLRGRPPRRHIGHQLFVTRMVRAQQHHGITHAR